LSRTRTQSFAGPAGGKRQRWFNNGIVNDDTTTAWTPYSSHTCVDDTGFGVDHALTITHVDKSGLVPITGDFTSGLWRYKYTNWYADYHRSIALSHLSLSPPSDGSLATTVRARSNPSKPYISVPNFLYELKDLPGMIRDIGYLKLAAQRLLSKEHLRRLQLDKSARGLANQQLSVQMGWQPLISDLAKLVDFQARVDRKVVELDTLFNKNGGLHRTVGRNPDAYRKPGSRQRASLWSNSATSTSGTITIDSAIGQLIQAVAFTHSSAESWGSIRWNATSLPKTHYSNKELTRRARNIVLGLNLTPAQIWNAIPWTWLVGWFTNIDEYLGAHTNVIPVSCSNVCIMRRTRTTVSYSRVGGGIATFVGGTGTTIYETKSRSVTSGSLSASFPFLSGRQLSILGALAIQRIR